MTRHNAHVRHHRRAAKHPAQARSAAMAARPRAAETTLNQWTAQRRSRVRWFFSFLVFATLLFLSAQAFAQPPAAYQSDPMDPALLKKSAVTAMDQAHKEGIGKSDLTPQWEKFPAFDAYYKKLIFGKMRDEAFVGELGAITQSLLDDLDRANRSRSPAAPLVRSYVISIAKYIAPKNYHPAARINATLLLALADDAPEDPRERKPPVPAAAAFVPLVNLYRAADSPDAVKAAALQGIARHVSLGAVTNPDYRKAIAGFMLDLAKSPAPTGRSPEAHAFMQRYAVDILGVLAGPSVSPDTANTLVSLSTDKEKPTLIAAYAASKISSLQPGKQKLPNLPDVLKTWALRASQTIDGELQRIANLSPPVAVRDQPAMPTDDTKARTSAYGMDSGYDSSMMGSDYSDMGSYDMSMSSETMGYEDMMMGMGMPGMMMPAKPQPLEVISSRRRINQVLQQLQLGVTGQVTPGAPAKPAGLLGAADPADQAAFDAWITTVSEVVTALNADTLDDRVKFVEALTEQSAILKKLAGIEEPVAGEGAVAAANALNPLAGPPAVAAPGNVPVGVVAAPAPAAPGPAAPGPVAPAGPAEPGPIAPGPAAPGAAAAAAGNPAPAAGAPAAPEAPAPPTAPAGQ